MAPWAITEARYGSVGPPEFLEKLQDSQFASAAPVLGAVWDLLVVAIERGTSYLVYILHLGPTRGDSARGRRHTNWCARPPQMVREAPPRAPLGRPRRDRHERQRESSFARPL